MSKTKPPPPPQVQYESYDEETGALSIGVGTLVFHTTCFMTNLWTWKACTQRGKLVVIGEGAWRHSGTAERHMRAFIDSVLTIPKR